MELKCPKCGAEFSEREVRDPYTEDGGEPYLEVVIICSNTHEYFTRIRLDDIIEA